MATFAFVRKLPIIVFFCNYRQNRRQLVLVIPWKWKYPSWLRYVRLPLPQQRTQLYHAVLGGWTLEFR